MGEAPLQAKAVAQRTIEISCFPSHKWCSNGDTGHSVALLLKAIVCIQFRVVKSKFKHMEHANLPPTCQISPNNAMVHCVITRAVVSQV